MNDCWLLTGDCREMLECVKEKSVHCCVTSPPYWGLRDYGLDPVTWEDGWIGCLGMEKSPDQFVTHLVEVFRWVWRVLRDDGTLWLNLGDSYTSGGRTWRAADKKNGARQMDTRPTTPIGLKEKDLVGIPWKVAFALQSDGWTLRSDIIWAKGNPMPESVNDRPTRSHEYLFLLTKGPRYHYDHDAIREPMVKGSAGSKFHTGKTGMTGGSRVSTAERSDNSMGRNRRTVWQINTKSFKGAHFATFPPDLVEPCIKAATSEGGCCFACGKPTVRVIERGEPDAAWQAKCGADSKGGYQGKATKDFASAKAQDASAVKARILAGMVEKTTVGYKAACKCYDSFYRDLPQARSERQRLQREITGDWWKRASRRPLDPSWPTRPAVALDPFAGSGTVGLVARQHKCRSILIEQSEEYGQLIRDRLGLE